MTEDILPEDTAPKEQTTKRLGKGLDALFNEANFAVGNSAQAENSTNDTAANEAVKLLPVTQLEVGKYQPRKEFETGSLDELAASIRKNGVLQPILVRPYAGKDNIFEIIAGERRWRASLIAGIDEVPVIIKEIEDQDALTFGLIENIQRENLNAIEEAEAYAQLLTEFDVSQEELGKFVHKSRSHIANFLRLNELTDYVKTFVREGHLSFGHARALLSAKDRMDECADVILKKNLSVRQTEALVKNLDKPNTSPSKDDDPKLIQLKQEYQNLASDVAMKIGLKVQIQNKKGQGQFIINFKKADELSKLVQLLTTFEDIEEKDIERPSS
jgi:ParB family chromosome partitioning protein